MVVFAHCIVSFVIIFDLNMYHQFVSRINEAMPVLYVTDISVAS